jgi:hypothetical protein
VFIPKLWLISLLKGVFVYLAVLQNSRIDPIPSPRGSASNHMLLALRTVLSFNGLPNNRTGNLIAGQILRSGTSPDANHGEARVAESSND